MFGFTQWRPNLHTLAEAATAAMAADVRAVMSWLAFADGSAAMTFAPITNKGAYEYEAKEHDLPLVQ